MIWYATKQNKLEEILFFSSDDMSDNDKLLLGFNKSETSCKHFDPDVV